MKTDRQIKTAATRAEYTRVFENMNSGRDIKVECSNGHWIRKFWKNPNGNFGWGKWVKLS